MIVGILLEYADWMDAVDIWYNPQKNNNKGRYTLCVRSTR